MKTLLLLRHAKSSWKDASLADHDRPLNKRGRRDAPLIGELVQAEGLVPDLIISSTARRALLTAEAVADHSGYEGEILTTRYLYHADPLNFVEVLAELDSEAETVMMVGHNPGIAEFLEDLTGEMDRFPTGALAQIGLPIQSWAQLTLETEGELVQIWYPRQLA